VKTIKQLAQSALDVQSASNISGVLHSYTQAMVVLRSEMQSTVDVNQHPISRLYASQVHFLAGMGLSNPDAYAEAYAECERLAADTTISIMRDSTS
jgi:hypothetical protein